MESSSSIWQQKLDSAKAKLQECQHKEQLPSCLQCPKLLGCEIRESYVKAVYESMNKGQGGGFEF
ncbi:MAG: hypothetical protein KU28_04940 [Sulfurovum sp. PC08-66]|jgi:hypothetical protein|nr:MAG: hypothetical protein KU28_04940 [Sulfurovum sp. PC08-66]